MQGHLEELLSIAKQAAQAAAAVHRSAEPGRLGVGMKSSPMDLVTAVDREAERELVSVIHTTRPHDAVIGEEGTTIPGSSGVCWIVDPLDGTTNFVYRYPAHAVAVGVEIDGKRVLGVVHDTYHHRLYTGVVGVGFLCDGSPIAAGATADLSCALVGTGFLPNAQVRSVQGEVLRRILPVVRDVRRSGCPALDLVPSQRECSTDSTRVVSVGGTLRQGQQSPRPQELRWSNSSPPSCRIRCWWWPMLGS